MHKNAEKCCLHIFLRYTIYCYVNESLYPSCFWHKRPRCESKIFSALRAPDYQRKQMTKLSVANFFFRAARATYQRKPVTQSIVAEFFSALRAPGLQKRNFLRAARARDERKRVIQSSVAKFSPRCARQGCKSKIFSALRAPDTRENG